MTLFRRFLFLVSLCASTTLPLLSTGTASAEVVDKVVAAVNGDVITLSELNAELAARYGTLMKRSDAEALARQEELRAKTLESIIDRRLIAQKAAQAGITVTDAEIDHAFEVQVERSGLNQAQFLSKMTEAGVSESTVRNNLKASILQGKLLNQDVRSHIVITNEAVKKEFDKEYVKKVNGKSYTLLQAGFVWGIDSSTGRSRSREKAEEMAEEMRAAVLTGEDFKELARKYSDLPSAADGGDIGSFTLDELAPKTAEAIKDLRPSQVSEIINTTDGYQFFQVVSTRKNPVIVTAEFDDVKNELREKLFQRRLQQEYEKWINDLKANAYIQKM